MTAPEGPPPSGGDEEAPGPPDGAPAPGRPGDGDVAAAPETGALSGAEDPPGRRAPTALATLALVFMVLVIVIVLVVLRATGHRLEAATPPVVPLPADVARLVFDLPTTDFDAVGSPPPSVVVPPVAVAGKTWRRDGKPVVMWVGAEFCPGCAAERWSLVIALGRFGTFSNLGETWSSEAEAYPHTVTFGLATATYASDYVILEHVDTNTGELASRGSAGFPTLPVVREGGISSQTLTGDERAVLAAYDRAPYTDYAPTLPVVDVANRVIAVGSAFPPSAIPNVSMKQVAGDLSNPSSPVAQAVLGAANQLTAAICSVAPDAPASVCDSSGVIAAARQLGVPAG